MKRILFIFTILMSICLSTMAQQGLRINDVFAGKVVPKRHIQESLIKGDNLAAYKLKVLHTAKFSTFGTLRRDSVEALFQEDMKMRISDDNSNMEMEMRNGHLYYAIVQLTDNEKGAHRYICYQCREKERNYDITLVYMEGSASLAYLRKTFKKK
ncbi:MAG: DUF6108 family protein [Bacteroidaceae bacterium]|nr:DUF6108 family protein [Bacteroidaceae bacterium]